MANTDAEGDRLGSLIGNRQILMMGNHGVLVCAATVAEAFDLTYYLERACRNLILAYSTGQKVYAKKWRKVALLSLTHLVVKAEATIQLLVLASFLMKHQYCGK